MSTENKSEISPLESNETGKDHKVVIIEIIKQDMRFSQYIYALRKLGIEVYDFDLDLMSIVAKLMNIGEEDMTDAWMELYVMELGKCEHFPIEALGKNIYPLAEKCYYALLNFNVSGGIEGDE
jgi:hypothetical protein